MECPTKVWTRVRRAPAPPGPSPNQVFPCCALGHAQPRWVTSASGPCPAIGPSRPLGSASCAAIGQRAGPRPIFLESSWKAVKGVSFRGPGPPKPESTTPPARLRVLAAQRPVLGSRRFPEGLGHRGQKIRRLAPPRPPVPPPASSRPARAVASQSLTAVCAPRFSAVQERSAPTGSLQPPPSGRAPALELPLLLPGHGPLRSGVSAAVRPSPASTSGTREGTGLVLAAGCREGLKGWRCPSAEGHRE